MHLSRNVDVSKLGPNAFYADEMIREYPYGKGEDWKTSGEAIAAAAEIGRMLESECSRITITDWHGHMGKSVFIRDTERRYIVGWLGEIRSRFEAPWPKLPR